jgi:hypothetical protein
MISGNITATIVTEIVPTGAIKVMDWDYSDRFITVDINDDIYKDADERCLRTTFHRSLLNREIETLEQYIERNRNTLIWTIAYA